MLLKAHMMIDKYLVVVTKTKKNFAYNENIALRRVT